MKGRTLMRTPFHALLHLLISLVGELLLGITGKTYVTISLE